MTQEAQGAAPSVEGLEPVREDAHRSPSGSVYRRLRLGEEIQAGDCMLCKEAEITEWDPLPVKHSVGHQVRPDHGNHYYRPLTAPAVPEPVRAEGDMKEALEALESAFIAAGRSGANANINHPLRQVWLAARDALSRAGGIRG